MEGEESTQIHRNSVWTMHFVLRASFGAYLHELVFSSVKKISTSRGNTEWGKDLQHGYM